MPKIGELVYYLQNGKPLQGTYDPYNPFPNSISKQQAVDMVRAGGNGTNPDPAKADQWAALPDNTVDQASASYIEKTSNPANWSPAGGLSPAEQAGVDNGTLIKIPIGSGFGTIPAGSAGAAALANPALNNTATPGITATATGSGVGSSTPSAPAPAPASAPNYAVPGSSPALATSIARAQGQPDPYTPLPAQPAAIGATASSTDPAATGPTYEQISAMKQTAANTANKAAQAIFDSLGTTGVDTRKSSEILAKLETSIETPPPAPPSLAEQFNTLKTQAGLDPLQAELTDLNNQVAALDTANLTQSDKAGDRVQSMPEITRRRSTLQKNTDIQKAYLNTQISAVSAQIANKVNTINMIMGFAGQDYQNATAYYSDNLDRNTTLYNLFNAAEQKDQTQADKLKVTAATNLTTIQNMLTDGKISYTNLTPAQQSQIALMEMQAGLPVGITAAISNTTTAAGSKVLTTTSRQDPTGNTFYDSLVQKPDGSLSVISTSKGQEILTAAEKKANPNANTQNPAASSVGQRPSASDPNVTEYYDASTGQGFASSQALADFVNKKNGNNQATAANVFTLLKGTAAKTTPTIPTTPKNGKPLAANYRTTYGIPSYVNQGEFDSVRNSIRAVISAVGTVNDQNRYDLWGQVADAMSELKLNPNDFDGLLWEAFSPKGLAGFKATQKANNAPADSNNISNPFK